MIHTDKICELITQDKQRLSALTAVHSLNLPQCYIAAGFVRNLVWDHLHHKVEPTPLNDIDVIYFDLHEPNAEQYKAYEAMLKKVQPQLNWQVRNQALMHLKNNDKPYTSTLDAMRYWPEKETAVAIQQLPNGRFECISAFGFDSLFNLHITYNPKRLRSIFEYRVNSKAWLQNWQHLTLVP